MSTSREERQAWIKAIHTAMIGSSGDFADRTPMSSKKPSHPFMPYSAEISRFEMIQAQVESAETKEEYFEAIEPLFEPGLSVPVSWVKDRADEITMNTPKRGNADDDGEEDVQKARGTLAQVKC